MVQETAMRYYEEIGHRGTVQDLSLVLMVVKASDIVNLCCCNVANPGAVILPQLAALWQTRLAIWPEYQLYWLAAVVKCQLRCAVSLLWHSKLLS